MVPEYRGDDIHSQTHEYTKTFGPISHNLKHLRCEETLEGDANMQTDILV